MISILVTAIGGGGHGDQILKALRHVSDGRYRLFGADANPNCPQAELVERFVTLPLASDPIYLGALAETCKKFGVNALFHGCEPELLVMSRNRHLFKELDVFLPVNDADLIDLCMDKARTNAALANLGFPAPRYIYAGSRSDLDQVDWFPVVIKPSVGGGGSANVYIAQDADQLRALSAYLGLGRPDSLFMIQEYVGSPEQEFTVGVLHDLEGRRVGFFRFRIQLSDV